MKFLSFNYLGFDHEDNPKEAFLDRFKANLVKWNAHICEGGWLTLAQSLSSKPNYFFFLFNIFVKLVKITLDS